MKRFLSWLTLFGCYFVFGIIVDLDRRILYYVLDLYDMLGPFLKLVVLIIGGSTFTGLCLAPLYYGIPTVLHLCEAVCPSRTGLRYIVFGVYACLCSVLEIIFDIRFRDLFFLIFGIALIVIGRNIRKENQGY